MWYLLISSWRLFLVVYVYKKAFLCVISEIFVLQSLVCLWMHTAAGVEMMISNGAVCLSHLVRVNQGHFQILIYFPIIYGRYKKIISGFVLTFQRTENLTCLWPTSTPWMLLRFRDMLLWGKIPFCFFVSANASISSHNHHFVDPCSTLLFVVVLKL